MTPEQLIHIVPHCKDPVLWDGLLNKYMPKYGINTKARIAPFIANCAHESNSFNTLREFGSDAYFIKYDGRIDLGNIHPGDGLKFKGRGCIQITGYNAYRDCSHALYNDDRLLQVPTLLEQPDAATESACWFWTNVKGLNVIADKPDNWTRLSKNGKTYTKFQWIVRLINGGQNGLQEREDFLKRANEIL